MERDAKKRSLPFLTSKAKAHQMYALDMTEDDFIEMAYDVWRTIGNIATSIQRYFIKVPEDMVVELPSNAEFIESVTIVNELSVIDSFDSGGSKDRTVKSFQEKSNIPGIGESITKSNGKDTNYILLAKNSLKLTSLDARDRDVMVVYRQMDLDQDGLPLLNDKEVEAIAAEVTKRNLMRKMFQGVGTSDKASIALLQFITAEAIRLLTAAKIDEKITTDGLNKILDAQTSWDRKQFGKRFNLIN